MVDLAPMRGLRFDRDVVADLSEVTAPPYDAIDAAAQERLLAEHPYNVVRLELGEEPGPEAPTEDRYEEAARTYARWCREGVLALDANPALYVYEQTFTHRDREHVQVGLLGALAIADWDAGEVLPHERVFRGPVEDRKRLLAALPANLSPVFVLVAETPTPVALLLDGVREGPADAAFRDDDGVGHRVWRVDDPEAHAAVAASLADVTGLMADGHHRWTTAVEHHAERTGVGTDRILAFVAGADRGPAIDPTHRLVRRLPTDVLTRLRDLGARVRTVDLAPSELARHIADAAPGTFGLVTPQHSYELEVDRHALAPLVAEVEPPVRDLDITLLQALLLGPLDVPDRVADLRYVSDVDGAARAVRGARADGLFLVRPVTFEQFRSACEAGVRMPPKSTTFVPKPRTGLVLRPLDPSAVPTVGGAG